MGTTACKPARDPRPAMRRGRTNLFEAGQPGSFSLQFLCQMDQALRYGIAPDRDGKAPGEGGLLH
jgi:hypothetical protein